MEAPCFSILAYTKSKKGYSKNKLLIFRKYRALLRMLPSSTGRSFPTLHRGIPNPINGRQNT